MDAAIIGFLLLQTFLGWRRGLLWQAAGVASIAFGLLLGWLLAPIIGERLRESVTSNPFHAKLVAFVFVVGVVGFSLRVVAAWAEVRTEQGLPKKERELRRADDRILGGIFGALKGSVLALVIIAASVAFCPGNRIWQHSKLSGPLAVAGSRLLPEGAVSEVRRWGAESAQDARRGLEIR